VSGPWLLNFLPYTPKHSGFSRYAQDLLPRLSGHRLCLGSGRERVVCSSDAPLLSTPPSSVRMRILQRLSLVQYGSNIREVVGRSPAADAIGVYSPYSDYIFSLGSLPQLITCHDLTPLHFPSGIGSQLRYQYLIPAHLFAANRVIAISEFVADQLLMLGLQEDRIRIIPNGIKIVREPLLRHGSWDWLVLARHDRNKNLAQVIHGFAAFLRLRPDWPGCLKIVGRAGATTRELFGLVNRLDITQRVEFISGVDDSVLVEILRSAFALISPSLMEGFDYPVMEAKAEGLPTLVSDIPVHREFHLGSSLFFSVDSGSGELASKMNELSGDPRLWKQLSMTGFALAQKFTLDGQASLLCAVFNEF